MTAKIFREPTFEIINNRLLRLESEAQSRVINLHQLLDVTLENNPERGYLLHLTSPFFYGPNYDNLFDLSNGLKVSVMKRKITIMYGSSEGERCREDLERIVTAMSGENL